MERPEQPSAAEAAGGGEEPSHFRELVERANDLFVIVGADGCVGFVNQSFCRLTGFSRDEVEGAPLGTLFEPDGLRDAHARLTSALRAAGPAAVGLRLRTKADGAVEVSFRASVERAADGSAPRMILVGQSPYLYGDLAAQFNSLHRDIRGYALRLERLNAELERRIDERTARMSALLEVSASLNAELQLDALFELILRQATETIAGAQAGALLLRDPERDRLLVQAACGYADGAVIQDLQAEMERTHPHAVFADRTVRVWGGEPRDRPGQMKHLLRKVDQFHIRSAVAAPVATPSEPLGVLLLHNFDEPNAFTSDDAALAASLAGSAAVAIVNARLYDETRRQAERLELVNRLAASVGDSADLEQTLGLAVLGLSLALGANRVAVTLSDESAQAGRYAAQFTEAGLKPVDGLRSPLAGTPLAREVTAFRMARSVADVRLDPRLEDARRELGQLGVESLVAVPLVVRDRLIGTIEIHQCDRVRRWREGEIALAESVARQLATAVHQVRLHAKLRRAARESQTLLDAMSDAVYVFDRDGRLSRANAAVLRIERLSLDELAGRRCCDLFGPDCPVGRALEGRVRTRFERQGGGSVVVDPLPDGSGAVATARRA